MTATDDVQARIRRLRAETLTAIEDHDWLAAEARRALIDLWKHDRICGAGCADALTGWGMELPPAELTMSGVGRLSFLRRLSDDEAREQARCHVPADVYRLLPTVDAWSTQLVEVEPVMWSDDYPDVFLYRITVQVTLQIQVTATSKAAAIERAAALVNERAPALTDAGITLTGLVWEVDDGPADLIHPAHPGPPPVTVRLPDADDDLSAATEARDAAAEALANLQHRIRHRAIRALADDELGGVHQKTAEQVEGFLIGLGLAQLPRAHYLCVAADLRLRVHAADGEEAECAVSETMRVPATITTAQLWTGCGWPCDTVRLDDGRWLVCWRQEYELRLRGHTDQTEATFAGEAIVRADLTRALADTDHDMVRLISDTWAGIDSHLDPDTD